MTNEELAFVQDGVYLYWQARQALDRFETLWPQLLAEVMDTINLPVGSMKSKRVEEKHGKGDNRYRALTRYYDGSTGGRRQWFIQLGGHWGEEHPIGGAQNLMIYGYIGQVTTKGEVYFTFAETGDFEQQYESKTQYLCRFLFPPETDIKKHLKELGEELVRQLGIHISGQG